MDREAQRHQRRHIGADTEESDVTETELTGVAEQQIEAHCRDREDPRDDQDVQHVEAADPKRDREQKSEERHRREAPHPIRSFRLNNPVGRTIRTRMMSRNPMASRYPDDT